MDIEIPNEKLAGEDIKHLFEHPDVQKRGNNYFREAIRYFHEPFNIHQENIETGDLHKRFARVTFSIFRANSKDDVSALVWEEAQAWVAGFESPMFATNLFLEIRPIIIRVFFYLIFGRKISEQEMPIFSRASANFHNTLKGKELRSIPIRLKMYEAIKGQLETSGRLGWSKDENLQHIDFDMLAKHIGGVFFNTGVTQATELICHTLVEIYRNPEIQNKLQQLVENISEPLKFDAIDKYDYLDYVLNESLRIFPEFGKTNREVSRPVAVKDITLAQGTVVYLNFQRCHQLHWDDPQTFKPERWDNTSLQATSQEVRNAHFMPFGVGSRRCPAEAFVRNLTKIALVVIMRYVNLTIPEHFAHTRRLASGVPALVTLNVCGQALRLDLVALSAEHLVPLLEQQHSLDMVDELAGLTFLGTVKKIATNLRYSGFSWVALYPLITGIHIWLSFQSKRIQRRLTKLLRLPRL
jgi:cytochrome P450